MVRALGTALIALIAAVGLAPAADAGGGCPPIKGSSNPSDPSYVRDVFRDVHGCQVPMREGIGHRPWRPRDFGYRHTVSRYDEGARNHGTTAAAKALWQQALRQSGKMMGIDYLCHYKRYRTPGGSRPTMIVFLDYKPFRGYAYKGIITAYWESGNRTC